GQGPARLLLAEPLPLHVRPDLLRHLRRADGLVTHDRLQRVAATLEVDRIATERRLLFRHSVSSLRRLGCGGPGPAPPDPAEGIMYALRGREKRKILSVGAPHEGETTGWGYGPRRGLRPPFRHLPQDGVRAAGRRGAGGPREQSGVAPAKPAQRILGEVSEGGRSPPPSGTN